MVSTFGVQPGVLLDTADDVADALEAVLSAFPPFLAANILIGWQYSGFNVSYETATGADVVERHETVVGTLAGGGFTSNTAVLIQKKTALGGRRHRGRMFIPPLLFSDIGADNNGFINGTVLSNMNITWGIFRADLVNADVPMVLHHSGVALDSQLVTDLVVQPQMATQRRRMR